MTHRGHEVRDEPILDPDLAIIDTHHHLFDRPALRYMLDDYLADAYAGHRIVASVFVETQAFARANGPEILRPLGEIEFANGVGAMADSGAYGDCRVCAAIVGHADLRFGDEIGDMLDRASALAPDRFRGVRQITMEHPSDTPFSYMTHRPPNGVLEHSGCRPALRQVAARGLSLDAAVFHHQLPALAALADAFTDLPIVLNHMGMPMLLDLDEDASAAVVGEWSRALRDLARRPNVVCKLGGLGLPFWSFGFDRRPVSASYLELAAAWKPYIETAIEIFGADRCIMESDFPPDRRSCGFVPLWNALKHIVRGSSTDEKAALFHRTAARVYRIDLGTIDSKSRSAPTSGAARVSNQHAS